MNQSYMEWILKAIVDDCRYTGLSFEDQDVREAIIAGLRDAAEYIESMTKPLH